MSLTGVHAFFSDDMFERAAAHAERLGQTHPALAAHLDVVRPSAAHTLASLRVPSARGAIVQKKAASLWPYKLVARLLERLLARFPADQFNLQTNTPVTSLTRLYPASHTPSPSPSPSSSSLPGNPTTAAAAAPRWCLTTPRGSIAARHVLLATNGYTSHLLPAFADLIVPVRGQVAALLPPPFPPSPSLSAQAQEQAQTPAVKLQHSYVFAADPEPDEEEEEEEEEAAAAAAAAAPRDDYLVQRPAGGAGGGGELIYGGGRRLARGRGVGEWRDDEVEPRVAAYLRGSLRPVLDLRPDSGSGSRPGSGTGLGLGMGTEEEKKEIEKEEGEDEQDGQLPASFEWTGVMGYSRDRHAWVGRVPEALGGGPGLWLCAGYTGHGMPAAALSARAVVRQMLMAAAAGTAGRVEGADGLLPGEFVLTEERVARARELPPLTGAWEATSFASLVGRQ